jgi:hypothetical protein
MRIIEVDCVSPSRVGPRRAIFGRDCGDEMSRADRMVATQVKRGKGTFLFYYTELVKLTWEVERGH